jgi:hypothetical protein
MAKDPYRGYRKYLLKACEICGYAPENPSELEAHHIVPQSEFRRQGKKVIHGRNISTVCSQCHTRITIGLIVTVGRVHSTAGHLLEYYWADKPEKMLYSKRGPL